VQLAMLSSLRKVLSEEAKIIESQEIGEFQKPRYTVAPMPRAEC
jgi:hypothetical protein